MLLSFALRRRVTAKKPLDLRSVDALTPSLLPVVAREVKSMIERIVVRGFRLYEKLDLMPNEGMNIIVGDNESGKSTLMEALALALTGRANGRWARDELNPYWFHQPAVKAFFDSVVTGAPSDKPEILIELYFPKLDSNLQAMRGVHNSLHEDCPGISLKISPATDYALEYEAYLGEADCPAIIPVEFYGIEWRDFADNVLARRPKALGVSAIDSRTIRSSAGVDYHTREMLSDYVEPKERAAIAVAHRKARHVITDQTLGGVNTRIAAEAAGLHDRQIGLQMDQSANASWESNLIPQVADIPFALAGQGQQAAIKIALAMNRSADKTAFALIEEPENHLSHTSLTKLVARIELLAGDRQVFLTTHSSFVLNRLGLDKLILLHRGKEASFAALPADTVTYFKRLSGYDTLRLVLAETVVLVEGPSDELLFGRAFMDAHDGKSPAGCGIDVVSMHGVALKRGLQLCAALQRKVIALRDNDGKAPQHWTKPLADLLAPGVREVCIGDPKNGKTLEPQLTNVNDEATLREVLGCPAETDLEEWMADHKTEAALAIVESEMPINYPDYFHAALALLG
jgi:putative ATP-dependent endonuclease of OLD family